VSAPEQFAGVRMLVVEDEAMVAMLVEDLLDDLGCVVVDVIASVAEGLRFATSGDREIDAAILDVNIGGEKVFPVADALTHRGIPFIFATGYGSAGIDARFHGRPVLAKPFRRDMLAASLSAVLQ
jgi:CheY-like chemotaxis protein